VSHARNILVEYLMNQCGFDDLSSHLAEVNHGQGYLELLDIPGRGVSLICFFETGSETWNKLC